MMIRATRRRIMAYSTRPCPFSCGASNMMAFLSERIMMDGVLLSQYYAMTKFQEISYGGIKFVASTAYDCGQNKRPHSWSLRLEG
jgi:hypothetical protein